MTDLELLKKYMEDEPCSHSTLLKAFTNEVKRRHFDQHNRPTPQYSYMDIAMFLLKELGVTP